MITKRGTALIARIGILAVLFLVPPQSSRAVDSPLVAGEPFSVTLKSREFDGMRINSVFIEGPSVALVTDTFGSWVPVEDQLDGFGFLLRHRRFQNVRLGVSEIQHDGLAPGEGAWRAYTESVRLRLGPSVVAGDVGDSEIRGGTIAIVGWRTRMAGFFVPTDPESGKFEQHILSTNGSKGLLFVLYGPSSEAERAKNDLQFFLSRLEAR